MTPKFRPSKYDGQFKRVGDKGQCRLCRKKCPWTKKSGTTCLLFHLTKHHPEEMEQLNNEQANRARSPDDNGIPFDDMAPVGHEVKQEIIDSQEGYATIQPKTEIRDNDESVIAMICKDRLPVTILEGAGFRELFGKLRPDVQLKPVTYYIENALPTLNDKLKEKIRIDLISASKVSLAFGTFKSHADRPEHVSLSAYWMIPEKMEPRHALFFFKTVPESSPNVLSKLIINYGIRNKTIGYISESQRIPRICWLENDSTKLPDFEGILNEIARSIYTSSPDLLRKIDRSVIDFQKVFSWREHKEILRAVLDTSAMQNSENSSTKENQKDTELTEEEMEVSNFVFNILEQLQKANDQIRHRFYQTASVIIPILKVLLHKLTNVVNNGASVSEQLIGRNVLNKLETASNNSQKNVVLKTATFLDPRFKNEFFSECHKNYMIHHFKARFDKVIKEEVLTEETTDFDQFVQVKSSTSPSEPKIVCLEKEIEAYLCKDTNSKTDPTDFWMQNQSQLPILKSLASEYLPIPASASGTEKLFEDGQKMISKGFISGIRDDFIFCSANIAGYGC